jgi:hypothetical protein
VQSPSRENSDPEAVSSSPSYQEAYVVLRWIMAVLTLFALKCTLDSAGQHQDSHHLVKSPDKFLSAELAISQLDFSQDWIDDALLGDWSAVQKGIQAKLGPESHYSLRQLITSRICLDGIKDPQKLQLTWRQLSLENQGLNLNAQNYKSEVVIKISQAVREAFAQNSHCVGPTYISKQR